jgi:hypothetical protein
MNRQRLIGFLLWALVVAAIFGAAAIYAAPRAKNHNECVTYADLAIVAASAAKHGIARSRLEAALPDIYGKGNEDSREISRLILDRAYSAPPANPGQWASELLAMCTERRGDMDGFLGIKL